MSHHHKDSLYVPLWSHPTSLFFLTLGNYSVLHQKTLSFWESSIAEMSLLEVFVLLVTVQFRVFFLCCLLWVIFGSIFLTIWASEWSAFFAIVVHTTLYESYFYKVGHDVLSPHFKSESSLLSLKMHCIKKKTHYNFF